MAGLRMGGAQESFGRPRSLSCLTRHGSVAPSEARERMHGTRRRASTTSRPATELWLRSRSPAFRRNTRALTTPSDYYTAGSPSRPIRRGRLVARRLDALAVWTRLPAASGGRAIAGFAWVGAIGRFEWLVRRDRRPGSTHAVLDVGCGSRSAALNSCIASGFSRTSPASTSARSSNATRPERAAAPKSAPPRSKRHRRSPTSS